MGLFQRGFEASREEKARQDEARENMGKKLWRFFIAKPEKGETTNEADLRFLTEEPINFKEHTLKTMQNGKTNYENYTCTGDNCPFCADGDKPTYKGAFLVVDRREFEYKDKDGNKKKGKDQVRLFVQGTRVVSQLDRISTKYGLSNREVTMVRLGSGTETTYTIEKGDKETLSSKEIEQLLPEKLREEYDGTMESLYTIVENQIMMCAKDYEDNECADDTDDEESEGVIGVDDEEEEEEKPKTVKKLGKKKKLFKNKTENSVKPRLGNSRAKKLFK